MELISVIVPCYNEQEVLPLFYPEIIRVSNLMKEQFGNIEFEFLFINDGSKDNTLNELRDLARKDSRVRYISFSRNFGKEAGMYAGLKESKGDYVVVMDADLQHPPAFLPQMFDFVKNQGYDCATTRRVSRKGESKVRSWFARRFYSIINKISQTEIVDGAQDFRFMNRKMVDSILQMSEYNRFSKGIFSWVGYKTKYIEYENVERAAGTTAWSFWKLFLYSIEGIVAFSTAPLSVPVVLGSLESFAGLVLLIVGIVRTCMMTASQAAWILSGLIAGFVGLTTICIGVLGVYMSKIYMEVKNRPIYLVSETEKDIQK